VCFQVAEQWPIDPIHGGLMSRLAGQKHMSQVYVGWSLRPDHKEGVQLDGAALFLPIYQQSTLFLIANHAKSLHLRGAQVLG